MNAVHSFETGWKSIMSQNIWILSYEGYCSLCCCLHYLVRSELHKKKLKIINDNSVIFGKLQEHLSFTWVIH